LLNFLLSIILIKPQVTKRSPSKDFQNSDLHFFENWSI